MARPKKKTEVFAVATAAPNAVFMRSDLAERFAFENNLTVFPITVLTEPDLRKQKKDAALAILTDAQKLALGLVKAPKAPPLPAAPSTESSN